MAISQDLKTFIQKEKHKLRFLNDAEEYIEQLENLEKNKSKLEKQSKAVLKELDKLTKQKEKLEADVADKEEEFEAIKDGCKSYQQKVNERGEAIIEEAKTEADKIIEQAQTDAKAVKAGVKKASAKLQTLEKQIAEERASLNAVKAEKAEYQKKVASM